MIKSIFLKSASVISELEFIISKNGSWVDWDKKQGVLTAIGLELGILALVFALIVYLNENHITLPFNYLRSGRRRPNLQDILVAGFFFMAIAMIGSFFSAFINLFIWQQSAITLFAAISLVIFIILTIRSYVIIRDLSLTKLANQNLVAMESAIQKEP